MIKSSINFLERNSVKNIKNLLLVLGLISGCAYAAITNNLLVQNKGTWSSGTTYKFAPIQGTNQYSAPMVSYSGNTYVANGSAQPTLATTPNNDTAWTALSVSDVPTTLTDGDIFIGNVSNVPAEHAVTGAISITNAGVVSATQSSFFTTNTGSINNVLTGGQVRYGTAAVGIIAADAESSVAVTYGTACSTGVYAVNVSMIEASNSVPIAVKVSTSSTTGFTAKVDNLSGSTSTQAGTLQYQTICH